MVRLGQEQWLVGELPRFRRPQRKTKDPLTLQKVIDKITKVRKRGYIEQGPVESLTHMFEVAKGDDIRLVYNGSSSGLNDALWAPHFTLPTVLTQLRQVKAGTHGADVDIGEMFLNFILHEGVRKYCGVDITYFRSTDPEDARWEEERPEDWERWNRDMMGLTSSPYFAIQQMLWAKEAMYGNRREEGNPFQWDKIKFNLPTTADYDPSLPWVAKIRMDGTLASEVFIYVDDARIVGETAERCWQATRRFASFCNSLGIQDAPRKRHGPSLTPEPWAGTVTHTDNNEVTGLVSQAKWDKTKAHIKEMRRLYEEDPKRMPRKTLESIRGFLIYVFRTYRSANVYLKGLHLTIDSWRDYRDMEGWKLAGRELLAAQAEGKVEIQDRADAPDYVAAVDRFGSDLGAMEELTEPDQPPRQPLRARKSGSAFYLMGDASGDGFGSGLFVDGTLEFESGDWANLERERTSNWREAENLVQRVERAVDEGKLKDVELFLFTDNIVFEGTYYKGTSSSKKLFDLTLRLRKAQTLGKLILHVIHIAGTRMKEAGIDGMSRGDMLEGMMAGIDPLSFLPLGLDANERSKGKVEEWVRSWWGTQPLLSLSPEGWFEEGQGSTPCLWMPPPAGMEVALECLAEARHKRPHVAHVVVAPRLMTHMWRKQIGKDADLLFTVPVGVPFWEKHQHEPLIVCLLLPVVKRRNWRGPWIVRGSSFASTAEDELRRTFELSVGKKPKQRDELGGELRPVLENPPERSGDILRKFLNAARRIHSLPKGVVRTMLSRSSTR
jgi:hypothetical protein